MENKNYNLVFCRLKCSLLKKSNHYILINAAHQAFSYWIVNAPYAIKVLISWALLWVLEVKVFSHDPCWLICLIWTTFIKINPLPDAKYWEQSDYFFFFNIVIFLFFVSTGTEQYSKYSGYAESYKWKDNHKDETPR